jgi:CBS domain-containing protein
MKKTYIKELAPYESASMIRKDTGLEEIVKLFVSQPSLHHLCVVDEEDNLLGLINRKKMFQTIFSHHISVRSRISELLQVITAETPLEIMTRQVISATEDTSIDEVIGLMIEHKIREMPVIDEQNHVVGFITILKIMQEWLNDQSE